MKNVNKIEQHI